MHGSAGLLEREFSVVSMFVAEALHLGHKIQNGNDMAASAQLRRRHHSTTEEIPLVSYVVDTLKWAGDGGGSACVLRLASSITSGADVACGRPSSRCGMTVLEVAVRRGVSLMLRTNDPAASG
jgi:hypothetical protein